MKSNLIKYIIPIIPAILATFIVGVTSCTSSVDGIYGSFPYVSLEHGQTSYNDFPNEGGVITLRFNTNRPLSASSSQTWMAPMVSGNTVTINVFSNESEDPRTATITISERSSGYTLAVTVKQQGSGVHTSNGNTLLQSGQDISKFIAEYTRINGNLIFGSTGNQQNTASPASETDTYTTSIGGTSYTFYRTSSISNADLASFGGAITEVTGGGLYIILNTAISNVEPLFQYRIKTWTLIGNDNLTSISDIADQNYITSLTIRHSPGITDLESVSGMHSLTYLDLSKNAISDISFLEGMQLNTLILGSAQGESNTISDISVLYGMTLLKKLVISGLPIPQDQIDALQTYLPDCEITAQNMPNEIPVLGDFSFQPSTNSMRLTYGITSPGSSQIIRKGFMFGSDPSSLTELADESDSQTAIDITVDNLDSASYYYVSAFAENGMGQATSETYLVYTTGRPVLDPANEISVNGSDISIKSTMNHPGDPETVIFGSLLGKSPDLSLENNLESIIHEGEISAQTPMPYTWADRFNGESGTVYYIRSFAKVEGIGTTYGEVTRVNTEGLPESPVNVFLSIAVPAWSSPEDMQTVSPAHFYGYYFRDDIIGSGETVYGSHEAENLFAFTLYRGSQDLVFSSLEAVKPGGENDRLQWNTAANGNLTSDLLIYTAEDTDIQDNVQMSASPERVSSRISAIRLAYFDASGKQCQNLSSEISSISITASGISSSYIIDSDGNGRYSGHSTLTSDTDNISTTSEQLLIQNINVLPSGTSEAFSVMVEITFRNDNTTITRTGVFKSLEPNCAYDLNINLYDFSNETGNQFTIDVIENIDKEIEF